MRCRVGELRAPAEGDRPRLRSRCSPGPAGLEIPQPGFDCRLPKAPVLAEADVRDPTRTGLSPDPLGLHSEALGEFVSGEQPVHDPLPDGVRQRAVVGPTRTPGTAVRLDSLAGYGGGEASDAALPFDVSVVGVMAVAIDLLSTASGAPSLSSTIRGRLGCRGLSSTHAHPG